MTVIRRWIVATAELWLPDGSPTSKPNPETEDMVVLAEDYDALAQQLQGLVDRLPMVERLLVEAEEALRTPPRDAARGHARVQGALALVRAAQGR